MTRKLVHVPAHESHGHLVRAYDYWREGGAETGALHSDVKVTVSGDSDPAPDLREAFQHDGQTEAAARSLWQNDLQRDDMVDGWLHSFSGEPALDSGFRSAGSEEENARAQELTGPMMDPVRAAIRKELGDSVRVYRVERPGTKADPRRALYSYTTNRRAAEAMAHTDPDTIVRADDVHVEDIALLIYQRENNYVELVVDRNGLRRRAG